MQAFVKEYVKTCNICMWNKSKRHKPYGLLKQLLIPFQPWESISIDFIEQLPESQGYTEILVKRGKRDDYYDKQVEKVMIALNHVLKGLWGEVGSGGIRKKLKSEYAAYLESKYRRNDGSSI